MIFHSYVAMSNYQRVTRLSQHEITIQLHDAVDGRNPAPAKGGLKPYEKWQKLIIIWLKPYK